MSTVYNVDNGMKALRKVVILTLLRILEIIRLKSSNSVADVSMVYCFIGN